MERFNLNTWLEDRSRKVIDDNGFPVEIIKWDANEKYPVVCLTNNGIAFNVTVDGKYDNEPHHGIFFADEEPSQEFIDEYQFNTICQHIELEKELFKKYGNKEEQDRWQGMLDWLKSKKDLILQKQENQDEKPSERIKESIYKIANIVFELAMINSGGKTKTNFSMQQIFDCYDAFEESDEKGREYYKKLEEYVEENGGPECKGLMYSPKV